MPETSGPEATGSTAPFTFEAGLQQLETIVKEMEGGDLPLERALELFERGMKLSEACRKQLEEAETRIEILTRRAGKIQPQPFRQRQMTPQTGDARPVTLDEYIALQHKRIEAALDRWVPAGIARPLHHPPGYALQPVRGRKAHPAPAGHRRGGSGLRRPMWASNRPPARWN